MKAEKKRVYYKVFIISLALFVAEYAILSLFMIIYNSIGNKSSIMMYIFQFIVTFIRGANICCYLYLTLGYSLFHFDHTDMI